MQGRPSACACPVQHRTEGHCTGKQHSSGCPKPRDLCHRVYCCDLCGRQWDETCSPQCRRDS